MDNRIFDVSRPHHSKPDATGKPVIVGHHPEMVDPMVREHVPDKPMSSPHLDAPAPVGGLTIGGTPEHIPVPPVSGPDSFMEQPQIDNPPAPKLPDMPPGTAGLHPLPGTPSQTSWHPDSELPIPAHHGHHNSRRSSKKLPLTVIAIVVALMGVYAAMDSGLILSGTNLPFHIFSQDDAAKQTAPSLAKNPASSSATLPTGFVAYSVRETDVKFAYPTAWGAPTVTSDPGFSKRGGTNQSDGTYAYLVSFATNKDVQITVTSSQYLPATRSPLYYDYQRWCTGTADGKFYKQLLHFSTAGGVDTPTTVTCDQGPLADATKFDETTIVQLKTTNPDGSPLGDLYTMSLNDNDLPVLRVKDATSANIDNIKKLLASINN